MLDSEDSVPLFFFTLLLCATFSYGGGGSSLFGDLFFEPLTALPFGSPLMTSLLFKPGSLLEDTCPFFDSAIFSHFPFPSFPFSSCVALSQLPTVTTFSFFLLDEHRVQQQKHTTNTTTTPIIKSTPTGTAIAIIISSPDRLDRPPVTGNKELKPTRISVHLAVVTWN